MALRDRLEERVKPLLEPGEQVQTVMLAQTGPTPWAQALIGPLILLSIVKRRIIAVTDRAVVVLEAGRLSSTKPKSVLARLPRSTRLGPVSGLWGKLELDGERLWVHKRFHKDIEAADARAA